MELAIKFASGYLSEKYKIYFYEKRKPRRSAFYNKYLYENI